MRWVSAALAAAAERDVNGDPIPNTALSDADKAFFDAALLARCDAQDGLEDGMILDTLGCDFDPASLQCQAGDTAECLSAAQVGAIDTAMRGPSGASGLPVYTGYLYDTGLTTTAPGAIPGLLNGAPSPVGGPAPPTTEAVPGSRHGASSISCRAWAIVAAARLRSIASIC